MSGLREQLDGWAEPGGVPQQRTCISQGGSLSSRLDGSFKGSFSASGRKPGVLRGNSTPLQRLFVFVGFWGFVFLKC